jgi:hypothetical protein
MKYILALLVAFVAFGQNETPSVVNARFETRASSGDLSAQIKSATPAWFGYAIKTRRNHGDYCYGGGTRLEPNDTGGDVMVRSTRPIPLEGTNVTALLFRVDNNQITKIRIFPVDCPLDAGGLPFTWISNVPAPQSIALLRALVHQGDARKLENEGLLALSLQDDPAALDALIDFAKADPSAHIREQALFWLAQKAGARAVATISDAILNDPDTQVKKRAVFALSQLPADEGVPKLISVARTQRNPEVRKQAFFWLGQSKDPRALEFFQEVLSK